MDGLEGMTYWDLVWVFGLWLVVPLVLVIVARATLVRAGEGRAARRAPRSMAETERQRRGRALIGGATIAAGLAILSVLLGLGSGGGAAVVLVIAAVVIGWGLTPSGTADTRGPDGPIDQPPIASPVGGRVEHRR